ncbi:MAG: OmpA family protein [Bdellovibrionales bacterium]|nr:OmpA family protein [Bdellovibrionales bacterium]
MKTRFKKIAAVTLATLAAGLVQKANASQGVSVQNFSPALGLSYLYTESAVPDFSLDGRTQRYTRYFLNANYNTINDPLVTLDPTRTIRLGTVIERMHTLDLAAGMELNGRVAFGVGLPLNMVTRPNLGTSFSPGDIRVLSKIYFNRQPGKVALALIPEMRLPTGSADLYVSDSSFSIGASLAAEANFGTVLAAANLGYRFANLASFQTINFRHRMPVSLGLSIPLTHRWYLNTEGVASIPLPVDRFQNPSELYVGLRYFMHRNFAVNTGFAVGDVSGVGSGDVRILAGIKFSPTVDRPDRFEAPIRVSQAAPSPRVVFTKKEIQISEEVKFETGKDVLTESGKNLLDEVASVMKVNSAAFKRIRIEGHTDERGGDQLNLRLSLQRAQAVKEYLSSRGVKRDVLSALGYGKRRPKQNVKSLSKTAQLDANRRVEFKVVN